MEPVGTCGFETLAPQPPRKNRDFGTGRILLHRESGFILAIASHEGAEGTPFTELATGLDHLGFVAESREELVEWEQKLDGLGVTYTHRSGTWSSATT